MVMAILDSKFGWAVCGAIIAVVLMLFLHNPAPKIIEKEVSSKTDQKTIAELTSKYEKVSKMYATLNKTFKQDCTTTKEPNGKLVIHCVKEGASNQAVASGSSTNAQASSNLANSSSGSTQSKDTTKIGEYKRFSAMFLADTEHLKGYVGFDGLLSVNLFNSVGIVGGYQYYNPVKANIYKIGLKGDFNLF